MMRTSFEEQWSFEQDKITKYKQKKVFRAQMLIDTDQLKIQKEKEYEKKIKVIEKKIKEERDMKKELKVKHEHKLEKAKLKNEQIQR